MAFLQRTMNRGSVSTGYDIDNSCKFEADNSEYIARTPSSAGNRKTWTLSFWIKRTELADGSNSNRVFEAWDGSTGTSGLFTSTDTFILDLNAGSNYFTSTQVFRDTAAWYHFVIRVDTTSGTASERARVYVNGSELAGSWNSNIGQNTDLTWNQDVAHNFARFHNNDGFVNAYYAEIINVDGTSLAPTAFGETDSDTGIWKPKSASPTYGTNGFKLEFKTSGSLGADTSGNSNTWTLNNIAAIDQATDTPTNNFCIFNAVQNYTPSTVLSDGGTLWDNPSGQNWQSITGTFAVSSGKWYWEVRGAASSFLGIADVEDAYVPQRTDGYYVGYVDDNTSKSIGMYSINGQVYNAPGGSPDGTSYGSSNMIGFALDMDNRKMWISKDGTWITSIGDPTTPSGGVALTNLGTYVYPAVSAAASNGVICAFGGIVSTHVSSHNMTNTDANGYGAFKSSPPSGYYALCGKNLAEFGGTA